MPESDTPQQCPLGQQMLRGICIFQVITAFPAMCILGFSALDQLFYPIMQYYYFFACVITALMAAGIVFIVYVQRKAIVTDHQNFCFEAAKASLATGLWLWLFLDAAFGRWQEGRLQRAGLAVVMLIILFYPSLFYTYKVWGKQREEIGNERNINDEENTERTPLLSNDG